MRIQWRGIRKDFFAWEYDSETDQWTPDHDGIYDTGSHFHLSCATHVDHEESCDPSCSRSTGECSIHHAVFNHADGEFCPESVAPDDWDWDEADYESNCAITYLASKDHVDHETKHWGKELPTVLQAVVYPRQ